MKTKTLRARLGLLLVTLGAAAYVSLEKTAQNADNQRTEEQEKTVAYDANPRYISGIVLGDSFDPKNQRYDFSMPSEGPLPLQLWNRSWVASRMNADINPGEWVKIRVPYWQRDKQNDIYVEPSDIVEIRAAK